MVVIFLPNRLLSVGLSLHEEAMRIKLFPFEITSGAEAMESEQEIGPAVVQEIGPSGVGKISQCKKLDYGSDQGLTKTD